MKKKIITSILGIASAVLCLGGFSACFGEKQSNGLMYEYRSGTDSTGEEIYSGMWVVGYKGKDKEVIVPNLYDDMPVVGIYDEAFAESDITSIQLPISVAEIGKRAFAECQNLTTITRESSNVLLSIGEEAFYECGELKDIIIANEIGKRAFYGCDSLVDLSTSGTYEGGIGEEAFAYCRSLTNVMLSKKTEYIGKNAFYKSDNIEYLEEYGAKYISTEDNPYFYLADADETLTYFVMQEDCEIVGFSAFSGCRNLEEMTLPFIGTRQESPNRYLGYMFGANTPEESASRLPSSLKKITYTGWLLDDYAFYGCRYLTEIDLTPVCEIGVSAFAECRSLTELTIPAQNISSGVLKNCTSLEKLEIPLSACTPYNSSIVSFRYHFGGDGCVVPASLKEVRLTQGERVSKEYFLGCGNIEKIVLESTKTISEKAFSGCTALQELYIPANTTRVEEGILDRCYSLTNISVDENNGHLKSVGGNLYTKNGVGLIKYAVGKTRTSFQVPDGVEGIWEGAFAGCKSLQSITLPEGLTNISNKAFSGCTALESITIPDSVTNIGERAFMYCDGLESVSMGEGINSVGALAFDDCERLTFNEYENAKYLGNSTNPYLVLIGPKKNTVSVTTIHTDTKIIISNAFFNFYGLTDLQIPDSVQTIGASAFFGCNTLTGLRLGNGLKTLEDYAFSNCERLQEIILPDSVTAIGKGVFAKCTGLTEIIIPINVTSMGTAVFLNCGDLTIYCRAQTKTPNWVYNWDLKDSALQESHTVVWGYEA